MEEHTHARTRYFNRHFPCKPGLASCPLDVQSPVILIISILTGQAETLHIFLSEVGRWSCTQHTLGYTSSTYIKAIQKDEEVDKYKAAVLVNATCNSC